MGHVSVLETAFVKSSRQDDNFSDILISVRDKAIIVKDVYHCKSYYQFLRQDKRHVIKNFDKNVLFKYPQND